MRALIIVLSVFLFVAPKSFSGELISSGVEIKDGSYFINLKIRVDVKKDRAMKIFNDSEKVKTLSHVVKKVEIVEKDNNGVLKKIRIIEMCLFGICMEANQNSIFETGDKIIEIEVPEQINFGSSVMCLEITEDSVGKTVIDCKLEAKPQFFAYSTLIFISKNKIEKKLVEVGDKLIKKIESMSDEMNK